ncbi:hypothetical protein [Streptomyces daliensis]|uniref:Uncharacterized protein n=1 Tax=Streptomyces daliensis TaxID=299421 RepID=A0A8T4IVH1_9ACTN|nr:hypothetical protein [Streptomyces daliensis]
MEAELQELADHLAKHGLQVAHEGAAPQSLRVTHPLNASLSDEIAMAEGRYVTDFGYEVGPFGEERECAGRIAHMLAATPQGSTCWIPPSGLAAELTPAGVHWDACQVPAYLGDRVLARLGRESGAVIRDPYGRRLTWLIDPLATRGWAIPEATCIQLLSTAQHVTEPPAWCTRSSFAHWARGWAEHGLTDARLLHVVIRAEHGPRERESRAEW